GELAAVLLEQMIKGHASALARVVGAEHQLTAEENQDDGEELEGDLARVRVRGELAGIDRQLHRLRELAVEHALAVNDSLAHWARLVVVFACRGVQGAPSGELGPLRPRDPVFEQSPQALHTARGFQGRHEDRLGELARRLVERRHLQIELGAEMGEEAALRHADLLGERTDGEGFESGRARLLYGGGEDLRARLLPLGLFAKRGRHVRKNSTTVRTCQALFSKGFAKRTRWKVTSMPAVAPQMKCSP